MRLRFFLIVVILCFGYSNTLAQNPLEITHAFIQIELDPNSNQSPPSSLHPDTLAAKLFRVSAILSFADTANIDSVHIKVGRTQGGDDVANVTIPFSGINLPSSICHFAKNDSGFAACVAASENNAYILYLEVWAEDESNNATPVYSMRIN